MIARPENLFIGRTNE